MKMRIALAALLGMGAACIARADSDAAVKKQLDGLFAKMTASFKNHDLKGVMSTMSDDYVSEMNGQKMDKAAAEAQMKGYMTSTKKVNSISQTISGLKVSGSKASGKTTFKLDCVIVDDQGMMGGKKGASHRLQLEEHYNATWTKTKAGWKLSREAAAGVPKMLVDGKPFNPGAPPSGAAK